MNDKTLKKILDEEYGHIEAPAEIKSRVLRSIDRLLLFKSLIELYANIPITIIQTLAQEDNGGRDRVNNK
jgi:hypothetical protein